MKAFVEAVLNNVILTRFSFVCFFRAAPSERDSLHSVWKIRVSFVSFERALTAERQMEELLKEELLDWRPAGRRLTIAGPACRHCVKHVKALNKVSVLCGFVSTNHLFH